MSSDLNLLRELLHLGPEATDTEYVAALESFALRMGKRAEKAEAALGEATADVEYWKTACVDAQTTGDKLLTARALDREAMQQSFREVIETAAYLVRYEFHGPEDDISDAADARLKRKVHTLKTAADRLNARLRPEPKPAAKRPREWDEDRSCVQCGKNVEPTRRCYAQPTCHACLPPPPEPNES